MSKLHRTHLFMTTGQYSDFVMASVGAFDEEKFYDHIDIQTSFGGFNWDVCISSEDFYLFMEFLAVLHMGLPSEGFTTDPDLLEPEIIPLDESLATGNISGEKAAAARAYFEANKATNTAVDQDEEPEMVERVIVVQEHPTETPAVKKVFLKKPKSVEDLVASGVTLEDFDEDE
jgi:hypothetical protein